jgi:Carbohydrate family 9 binding domain-like
MTDARTSPRPEAAAGYRVKATLAKGATLLSADDTAWSAAGTIAWGPPRYRTAFRALWTAHALYARFDATDPDPWHTMSAHDDCLWEEEVVELFLDPAGQGRDYFELEISPANVTCDVRVRTPYPNLVSELAWEHDGLATAVRALRDETGTVGWTAAAELPWGGFRSLPVPSHVALPPESGDSWRFNAYRIKRPGGPQRPKDGALLEAWSPTGTPSFHVPAAFRPLRFA